MQKEIAGMNRGDKKAIDRCKLEQVFGKKSCSKRIIYTDQSVLEEPNQAMYSCTVKRF